MPRRCLIRPTVLELGSSSLIRGVTSNSIDADGKRSYPSHDSVPGLAGLIRRRQRRIEALNSGCGVNASIRPRFVLGL